MRIFDKLFDSRFERELKRKISTNKNEVEREFKPIGDISLAIIKASHQCFETIKPFIDNPNNKEKQQNEILLFYEFIYFFMHLTNRIAVSDMNSQQFTKLQEYIGPIISGAAVDTFFNHWPEDIKSRMNSDFYENLNIAEYEYSKSKEIFSEKKPYTSDSLFSMLARNVAELTGSSMNPATMIAVMGIATKEFSKMQLAELIQTASKVL